MSVKVKFGILSTANEEYIFVLYRCRRNIDSNPFVSSSLDSLVKTFVCKGH